MHDFLVILAYWALPFLAFAAGLLSRHPRVLRLRASLPRLSHRPDYDALSYVRPGDRREQRPRLVALVNAVVLASGMYLALRMLTGDGIRPSDLGLASVAGIGAGLVGLGFLGLFRSALSLRRATCRLGRQGMLGVWSPATQRSLLRRGVDGLLEFGESCLAAIRLRGMAAPAPSAPDLAAAVRDPVIDSRLLSAISADGRDVLTLLASNPANPVAGPDPLVRGARLRLLLVPPRSSRVDPTRKRLSTAEVSLAMIDRSPEDHWRHLRGALAIQKEWQERHGVQIEVRFLESRPAFACLASGDQVWVRSWARRDDAWLELLAGSDAGLLGTGFGDYFENEWARATRELDVPLVDGATGSTVIRKGIDVPEMFQHM